MHQLQVSGLLKDIIEAPNIDGFRALKPDALAAALFAAAKYPGRFRSLVVGTGASAFPARAAMSAFVLACP